MLDGTDIVLRAESMCYPLGEGACFGLGEVERWVLGVDVDLGGFFAADAWCVEE